MESNVDFSRAVLLELPKFSGPYFLKDFKEAVSQHVDFKHVEGITSLQQKHRWILTIDSVEVRNILINIGEMEISGNKCIIKPVIDEFVEGKIHWLPIEVPDSVIKQFLNNYCSDIIISKDKCTEPGFENLLSGKRSIRMKLKKGITIDRIPHLINLCNFNCLIVLKNRAPLCLRCKETGHIKMKCTAPFCSTCKSFKHDASKCSGPTYASKANSQTTKENQIPDQKINTINQPSIKTKDNKDNPIEADPSQTKNNNTECENIENNSENEIILNNEKRKKKRNRDKQTTQEIPKIKLALETETSDAYNEIPILNSQVPETNTQKRKKTVEIQSENQDRSNSPNETMDIDEKEEQLLSSWADSPPDLQTENGCMFE